MTSPDEPRLSLALFIAFMLVGAAIVAGIVWFGGFPG